ncbi:replicase [Nephila clavipes virus 2]|uniref:replicase n=1 Tax=Nephila clavipes virus 2 TaxID=2108205 RepID=UPI000D200B99|nr:replicase [Nephila clavipes virus 2]AVK59474.1 replicase [Nephila clavipes virus 2]
MSLYNKKRFPGSKRTQVFAAPSEHQTSMNRPPHASNVYIELAKTLKKYVCKSHRITKLYRKLRKFNKLSRLCRYRMRNRIKQYHENRFVVKFKTNCVTIVDKYCLENQAKESICSDDSYLTAAEDLPPPIEAVDRRHIPSFNFDKVIENQPDKPSFISELSNSFKSDFFDCGITPTLEVVLSFLQQLKPINLISRMADLAAAKDFAEESAVMTAIFELYDVFWTPELCSIKAALIGLATYTISAIIKACWTNSESTAMELANQAFNIPEDSKIKQFCNDIGFNIPPEFSDIGLKIIGVIVVIFLVITGGKVTDFSDTTYKKLVKNINAFSTQVKSLNNLIDGIPKLWTFCMSQVATLFGIEYEDESSLPVKEFKDQLLGFKILVTDLVETLNSNPTELMLDPQKLDQCFSTMMKLDILYDKLLKQKENMSATKVIFDEVRENVKVIQNYVQNLKNTNCQKIEPFVLVLGGNAGIGKSKLVEWITYRLTAAIAARHPEFSELKPTTYCRNSKDEFWPQYAGQAYIVYDDFGQIKTDTDHADLMLVKNPNKTMLTMSESKEKGRQFSSFGIIACTNQESVTSSAVVKCTHALTRRFEVNVMVSDPNYADFVSKHGCSPGNYEKIHKAEGLKAMAKDIHGNDIPYFDPNFDHLDFWFVNSDPAERSKFPPEKCSPTEIVERTYNYWLYYYTEYRSSLERSSAVYVSKEIFDSADSDVSGSRRHDNYACAKTKEEISQLKNAHAEADNKLRITRTIAIEAAKKSAPFEIFVNPSAGCLQDLKVLANPGKGDCLYYALEQLGVFKMSPPEIRTALFGNPQLARMPRKEYEQLKAHFMAACGTNEYLGTTDVLSFITCIMRYRFCVHFANSIVLYGNRGPILHLQFTGPITSGHWEALVKREAPSIFQTKQEVLHKIPIALENKEAIDVINNIYVNVDSPFEAESVKNLENQSLEEVNNSATAFVAHSHPKGRIVALYGPPGTGKTTLMRKVSSVANNTLMVIDAVDIANLVISRPVLYIEDISKTKNIFKQCRSLIMSIYDGNHPVQLCFVTFNPEMARNYCDTEEEWLAFARRLDMYEFGYKMRERKFFSKNVFYNYDDVEKGIRPYSEMVYIKDIESTILENKDVYLDSDNMVIDFADLCSSVNVPVFKKVVTTKVPYIGKNQYTPTFILSCRGPIYETFKDLYTSPIKIVTGLVTGSLKMLKGSFEEGKKIAQQFSGAPVSQRPAFPETIERFLIMINNADFRSNAQFITEIRCSDASVVIMPKESDPQVIRCFKVCDRLDVSIGEFTDGVHTTVPTAASFAVYDEYIDNAKKTIAKIGENIEEVSERVTNFAGFTMINAKFSWFEQIWGVCMFLLKIVSAGMSIHTLVGMAKAKFLFQNNRLTLIDEKKSRKSGKGKNKTGRGKRISNKNLLKQKYHNVDYASLVSSIRNFGDFTAKQACKYELLEDFSNRYEIDPQGNVERDSRWTNYLTNCGQITNGNLQIRTAFCDDYYESDSDYDYESGKVGETPQPPQVGILPELVIEKDKIKLVKVESGKVGETPQVPQVGIVPELIIEKNVKKKDLESETEDQKEALDVVATFFKSNGMKVHVPLSNAMHGSMKSEFDTMKLSPKRLANDRNLEEESLLDPSILNITKLASRNTVELGYLVDGKFDRMVYGIMGVGKIGASVAHFINPEQQVYVKSYLVAPPEIAPVKILLNNQNLDVCMFEIQSKTIPNYKNILPHFPTYESTYTKKLHRVRAIIATTEREGNFVIDRLLRNVKLRALEKVRITGVGEKTAFTYMGYMSGVDYEPAPINTTKGDCGSIVLLNDVSQKEKIIGVHNAGSEMVGACSLIFREYFHKFMLQNESAVIRKSVCPKHHENIEYREVTNESLLDMPIVGSSTINSNQPLKTKFWTSPLKLPGVNEYQPAILSKNDRRLQQDIIPYYESIKKWAQPTYKMDEELLNECVDEISEWYADVIEQEDLIVKVMTKTEAINAGKNVGMNPLNRKSSPGFPWRSMKTTNAQFLVNKSNSDNPVYSINLKTHEGQKLNNSIDDLINICRDPGRYPKIAFSGALKDEPIKLSKIENYNTRSFAGAPFDYTIASRMYFGSMQGAIHEVRHRMPIQVGITPTSLQWHKMFERLFSVSEIGCDLDFKGWDSKLPWTLVEKCYKTYNKIAQQCDPNWTPEDDIIRENLHRCVVRPYFVVGMPKGSYIVQAPGGMPSGSPRTVDDNSLAHLYGLYYCFRKIMAKKKKFHYCNIEAFKKLIAACIYGDDGAYAIHPSIIEDINFITLQAEFAKFGMECTPATKDDKIQEFIPVILLEFLKRETVKIGAFYYGRLKKTSFQKMLGYCLGPAHHWYNEPDCVYSEKLDDLAMTANSALLEALTWGSEFYNEIRNHLKKCFKKLEIKEEIPSFKSMISISELPLPYSF